MITYVKITHIIIHSDPCRALEQVLRGIEEKAPHLSALSSTCDELRQLVHFYQIDYNNLTTELADTKSEMKTLQDENQRLRMTVVPLEKVAHDAQSQLRCVLRQRIEASLDDDKDVLFSNLEELLQSNQTLVRRLHEREVCEQMTSPFLSEQPLQAMGESEEDAQSLQEIEYELEKLRRAREEQDGLVRQLVAQRDLYRVLLVEQTTSLSSTNTMATATAPKEDNLKEQLLLLQDELAKAKADLVGKDTEHNRTKRALESTERSRDEVRTQLLALQKEMSQKVGIITQLESEVSTMQTTLTQKQQVADQLRQEVTATNTQMKGLQTELETLRSDQQAQLEAMNAWHEEKTKVASLLTASQEDAERSTATLTAKVEALETEVSRLQNEVATREARISELAAVEVVRLEEVCDCCCCWWWW